MSRRYDRLVLTGRIEFNEDFASRATQERGVPINLDELIVDQNDPLLLALLARQRQRSDEEAVRWYAEHQSMMLSTF